LAVSVPPAPEFGEVLPIEASPEVIETLARRRSASAMTLHAPAPSPSERGDLLRLAARAPDHGKLNPWRFIILEGDAKAQFAARLETMAAARPDAPKATAALGKLKIPPLAVVVISAPVEGQIPEWEQVMSAGAVCTLMLTAAAAMGYGANWITDWYAFDDAALALLGVKAGERIAGFIYLGTATEAPQERVRPDVVAITSVWTAP
jgi:nitroreductase